MHVEFGPGVRYLYSRYVLERSAVAGLSHDDIAAIAQKRFAMAVRKRPNSTPAQGGFLETFRRQSQDGLSNLILQDALLTSTRRIDVIVRAAILMHEKHGIPTGNINRSSIRRNVVISFGYSHGMEVLHDEDLTTIEGNYRQYNGTEMGRANQRRAAIGLINNRRRQMGLDLIDEFRGFF